MTQELRIGDVTFSVETEGSGPPIVFIHGWSMSGRFFQRQLGQFPGHQVIVPDLRGHGRSGKVTHGHTVPQYAADLRAILAELSVRRPVLVGWSMGAMVAYDFLRQFGDDSVEGDDSTFTGAAMLDLDVAVDESLAHHDDRRHTDQVGIGKLRAG